MSADQPLNTPLHKTPLHALHVELGAKMGMVAPDETTFEFLRGRPYAPQGEMWDLAVKAWRELPSDPDAVFDREVMIDVEKIIPQVTWGISPEHVVGVVARRARVPQAEAGDAVGVHMLGRALEFGEHREIVPGIVSERIAGRTWPASERRVTVLELHE